MVQQTATDGQGFRPIVSVPVFIWAHELNDLSL